MTSKRNLAIGATFLGLLAVLGAGQSALNRAIAQAQSGVTAPRFEVDPAWPKPLPNGYQLGQTIGVAIDNIAMGIGIGIAIGIALNLALRRRADR